MNNERFKRIFLIVLDSVGIGEAPDASIFGDVGAHTLKHIAEQMNGLHVPQLERLGLGRIERLEGVRHDIQPVGSYGKMEEKSNGKDTMTGHWELMGLHIEHPFQVYPQGFPQELIDQLERETGRKIIGNKVASGTTIIEELGKEQMKTGAMIVYTSADSVLQIAAHEDVIPLDELYDICERARKMTLQPPFMVGRVIARPFVGHGPWERTSNRRDYALKPFGRTVMNELEDNGLDSIAIGKIHDIFDGEGITRYVRTISNDDGMKKLSEEMERSFHGLCFVNLVDFDALFGHRRDPIGYGRALERFDEQLEHILHKLANDDLLIITADHGNDPTFSGTDHTREYVPLLTYSKQCKQANHLHVRSTFADVGATIADNFQVPLPLNGRSFLGEL